MAEDLIEHAGRPASVGHVRAALVFRTADQVGMHRAVRLELLAAESEPARSQAPARAAQRDRRVWLRRELEIRPRPR